MRLRSVLRLMRGVGSLFVAVVSVAPGLVARAAKDLWRWAHGKQGLALAVFIALLATALQRFYEGRVTWSVLAYFLAAVALIFLPGFLYFLWNAPGKIRARNRLVEQLNEGAHIYEALKASPDDRPDQYKAETKNWVTAGHHLVQEVAPHELAYYAANPYPDLVLPVVKPEEANKVFNDRRRVQLHGYLTRLQDIVERF